MRSDRSDHSQCTRLAALCLLLATSACFGNGFGPQRGADYLDDKVLTTRVEDALSQADAAVFANVEVETHDGVVHLTGRVPSLELKERAERIARDLPRVSRVQNDLQIGT